MDEFNYPRPEPIQIYTKKGFIRICPWCYQENNVNIVELKGKSFLCKHHYTEFRRDKESARITQKRKQNPKYFLSQLGTTDFGSHVKRKKDGSIDWEWESKIVHNEFIAVFKGKTSGYKRAKRTGQFNKDAPLVKNPNDYDAYVDNISNEDVKWIHTSDGWEVRMKDYDDFKQALKRKSKTE
jgi:hypothetical protein